MTDSQFNLASSMVGTESIAITRAPGPELLHCQLTHLDRQPIDFQRAVEQHQAYQAALRRCGFQVVELPADPAFPDGVFVEDAAVVLEELAIITSPTPVSRRGEVVAIEASLHPFRSIARLPPGSFLEGGDVLRLGRALFVGRSSRTNDAGIRGLAEIVRPLGYSVVAVPVAGCLHLKSACTALDDQTVLINRHWVRSEPFDDMRLVDLPAEEPWGANVLSLPGAVLVSAAFPRTGDLVQSLGYAPLIVDVSELHKAESGLTCMSLLFSRLDANIDPV